MTVRMMTPASAQAQAEATKEAQRAGIEHAKAKADKYRGRKPSYTNEQLEGLGRDVAIAHVAKAMGVSRQTVYRIKEDPAGSEEALAIWGLASRKLLRSARPITRN